MTLGSGSPRASDARGRGRWWLRATADHGSVTAEFATVLPAVVVVSALLLAALGWGMSAVRCQEAAGAIARAVARGEGAAAVQALAPQLLPGGARWDVRREGRFAEVRVEARVAGGPVAQVLPRVTATALVPVEP